jgi:pyruvate/2-oxoacid:ferredoxin oxidoreductase alpha subunit
MVEQMRKGQSRVITGNAAAAYGAMLCRPDVIAIYPITPQSEVGEQLARFKADGLIDAEMVEVEGENSAMNTVAAAALAGGRVFTGTSSYGLVFMYDALLETAGHRSPVVMANVNRETPGILAVSCGQQDMISTRDSGWIQLIVEDNQEILDTLIMCYRLAEDYDIQLPVMLNYDGYYVSYSAESVNIPAQEEVDSYLAALSRQPERMKLVPGSPQALGTHGILLGYTEMRYKHMAALERAKAKFDQVDKEFGAIFGRSYGGQIEEYKCEDAEIILVTSGSAAGTAKVVVDKQREQGLRIGLVKIRMYRPFPREKLTHVLKGKRAVGVLDRSIGFGLNCGPMYMETRALGHETGYMPMLSFIDGLANIDITAANVERMVRDIEAAGRGKAYQEVTWISLEEQ